MEALAAGGNDLTFPIMSGSTQIGVSGSLHSDGFLVKNWNFSGSGTSGIPFYSYQNIFDITTFRKSNSYLWISAEVTDQDGIGAQGNNNPASWFTSHIIVPIEGGRYYDPSYGVTYDSIAPFQSDFLDGFFLIGFTQLNGQRFDAGWIQRTPQDVNITQITIRYP